LQKKRIKLHKNVIKLHKNRIKLHKIVIKLHKSRIKLHKNRIKLQLKPLLLIQVLTRKAEAAIIAMHHLADCGYSGMSVHVLLVQYKASVLLVLPAWPFLLLLPATFPQQQQQQQQQVALQSNPKTPPTLIK
jgi:hypothetical protein